MSDSPSSNGTAGPDRLPLSGPGAPGTDVVSSVILPPGPPLDPTQATVFDVQGLSGVRRFSGYVFEEFLVELSGFRGRQVIREMRDNDPILGAVLFAIEMLIRRVTWRVDPFDPNEPQCEADAALIEECLGDMENTWEDTLAEILTMLPFGWELSEILFKQRLGQSDDPTKKSRYSDGLIGWRAIAGRSQETLLHWDFDEWGNPTAMVQLSPPDYQLRTIHLSKALLFRTTVAKNNPEGRSIFRNAYLPWYRKKFIEIVEAIGIERDLAGLPIVWAPAQIFAASASDAQKAQLQEFTSLVTNIRRDEQEGIVMPLAYDDKDRKMYDLTLLSTGGTRQFDTDKVVSRYDQRMAMVVLADFVLLGHEQVGTQALSENKTDIFTDAISSWLDVIASPFNDKAIPMLMRLNGRDATRSPILRHGALTSTDLTALGTFLANASKAGMPLFPNSSLESWLLRQIGAPTSEDEPGQKEMSEAVEDMMGRWKKRRPGVRLARSAAEPEFSAEPRQASVSAADASRSAMLCLVPPPDVADAIAIPGGEAVGDLHVTLAYYPDGIPDADLAKVRQAISRWASRQSPLSGTISGMGRFSGEDQDALYLSPDVAGLPEARSSLLDAVTRATSSSPADNHGFTPHLTIDYLAPGDLTPPDLHRFAPVPVDFDSVWLWSGGERMRFPLGG